MYLRCQALRWLDDEPQPGIVEVTFPNAEGEPQVMIDKCVVFDAGNVLRPHASYPIPLDLPVEIVDRRTADPGVDLIAVVLPWGLGDDLVAHPVWVRGDQVVEH